MRVVGIDLNVPGFWDVTLHALRACLVLMAFDVAHLLLGVDVPLYLALTVAWAALWGPVSRSVGFDNLRNWRQFVLWASVFLGGYFVILHVAPVPV